MSTKPPVTISVILTIILLLVLGALSFFMELVALNGYGEREGGPALITFGVCQGAGLILSAIFAAWLTNLFVKKFNWNKILTVVVSVLAALILGGGFGVVSFIASVIVAEGMR